VSANFTCNQELMTSYGISGLSRPSS